MAERDKCRVCGRKPGPYNSLCFGVHANCSSNLEVERLRPNLFKVLDRRRPKKVWYCINKGMDVVEKPNDG